MIRWPDLLSSAVTCPTDIGAVSACFTIRGRPVKSSDWHPAYSLNLVDKLKRTHPAEHGRTVSARSFQLRFKDRTAHADSAFRPVSHLVNFTRMSGGLLPSSDSGADPVQSGRCGIWWQHTFVDRCPESTRFLRARKRSSKDHRNVPTDFKPHHLAVCLQVPCQALPVPPEEIGHEISDLLILASSVVSFQFRVGRRDAEEKLTPLGFVRIHRSILVNTTLVKDLRRDNAGTYVLRTTDTSVFSVHFGSAGFCDCGCRQAT